MRSPNITKNTISLRISKKRKNIQIFSSLFNITFQRRSWQIDALSVTLTFPHFVEKIRVSKFRTRLKTWGLITCNLNKFYPSINDKHIHLKLAEDATCIKIYYIRFIFRNVYFTRALNQRGLRPGSGNWITLHLLFILHCGWLSRLSACGLYILTFRRLMIPLAYCFNFKNDKLYVWNVHASA